MSEETQIVERESSEFTETLPGPLSLEDAHIHLQNKKAERQERQQEPEKADEELPIAAESEGWQPQDVETYAFLQTEAQRFQQDWEQFIRYKSADLNQLTNGDKAQRVALQHHLNQAEKELKTRYEALQAQAGDLVSKAEQKRMDAEWKKLKKEKPDYDAKANIKFLKALGATDAELATITDHRLAAIVDDARRYREQQAKPRKGKIPTRKPKGEPKEAPEVREARERLHEGSFSKQDAMTVIRNPAGKKQPTVADLKRKLHQTGSVNDAYALLQAQKQARAS